MIVIDNNKQSKRGFGVIVGILVAVVLIGIGFVVALPLLSSEPGSAAEVGSQVELPLQKTAGSESLRYEIPLPPTDGEIKLVLEPSEEIEMVRNAEEVAGSIGMYRIDKCINGCSIQIEVSQTFESGSVTITYSEDDSEYVDNIEIVEMG